MNDIVQSENNQQVAASDQSMSEAAQFLTVIERMASNPQIDVAKLDALMGMQERMMKQRAEVAFNEAMARLQPKLKAIHKDSKAHNSTYAKSDKVDEIVRPLYSAEGFSVSYTSKKVENDVTYYGTISHVMGHSKTAEMVLPADTSGSKNPIQAIGSTVTYANRYLLKMLLNLVFTDDKDDNDGDSRTKVITDDQAAELKEKLREKGALGKHVKSLCHIMGVNSVDEIHAKDYERAKIAINELVVTA